MGSEMCIRDSNNWYLKKMIPNKRNDEENQGNSLYNLFHGAEEVLWMTSYWKIHLCMESIIVGIFFIVIVDDNILVNSILYEIKFCNSFLIMRHPFGMCVIFLRDMAFLHNMSMRVFFFTWNLFLFSAQFFNENW